jgi:hypothetical protein
VWLKENSGGCLGVVASSPLVRRQATVDRPNLVELGGGAKPSLRANRHLWRPVEGNDEGCATETGDGRAAPLSPVPATASGDPFTARPS